MLSARAIAIAAAIGLALVGAPRLAAAQRVVAVTPLTVLGTEDSSPETKALTASLERALAAQPGTTVIGGAAVLDAIKKAKRGALKSCEGDQGCLAQLGKLVGAQIVIAGEIGGLGASKVVYLGATDVAAGKELRSTTLTIGAANGAANGADDAGGGAAGAAVRLLDPDKYVGQLHLAIDVPGATAYVNGKKVGVSPMAAIVLPVGTHAIRINHPEFHDFVRFVDVAYGKTTEIPVGLQQYPIVERDVRATNRGSVIYVATPIYRRWYVVAVAAVIVSVAVALVADHFAFDKIHVDGCRQIGTMGEVTCE